MPVRPATLTAAAVVVLIEGLAALGEGLYVGLETIIGRPSDAMSALALAGLAVAGGAAIIALAWGLWQVRSWARGPSVVIQIIAAPMGFTMIGGGQYALGVALLACAAVALVGLLTPPTTQALYPDG
ncbi:MAG: hypothetical protein GEV11_07740 [Streptosporangiales bacterium]|nr:hypothetical protein [Streptosporangiales bacterium]